MLNGKIKYFMNALCYGLWLQSLDRSKMMKQLVFWLLSPIPKYFMTEKCRQKFYMRQQQKMNENENFLFDEKDGFYIQRVYNSFNFHLFWYAMFISSILCGLYVRIFDRISYLVFCILFVTPCLLIYAAAESAVFSNNQYLRFFKQFKKKDERWQKKWQNMASLYCVGAWIVFAIGIFIFSLIAMPGAVKQWFS